MKIDKLLLKFSFAFIVMMSIFSCADSEEFNGEMSSYGDMQLKLYKEAGRPKSESRVGGDAIDYLVNIAKVKLSFTYNNSDIELILPMNSSIGDAAEFGIGSDPVKMMAGTYKLKGYLLYDRLDQEIGYGEPTIDEQTLVVEESNLSIHNIFVNAVERGRIKFNLTKDLSDFSRVAAEDRPREYTFTEIATFDITLKDTKNEQSSLSFTNIEGEIDLQYGDEGSKSIRIVSDSILYLNGGSYKIYSLTLKNSAGDLLEYTKYKSDGIVLDIKDNVLLEADVPVKIYSTDRYIFDYYALKDIWVALDGPNWHYKGDGIPDGANWNFNKDVDMWGQQPGVALHHGGRVATLNIGSFNPNPNNDGHGDIPDDALGTLTELVELFIGTHNDRVDEIGTTYETNYNLNPYLRSLSGNPINKSDEARMEYAKDLFKALHPIEADKISDIIMDVSSRKGQPYYVAPAPYAVVPHGYLSNRITSIPASLGKLTKLKTLFIANTLVADLPDTFVDLVSLTDLEIYNCPKMVKIPDVVAKLSSLVLVNVSVNEHMQVGVMTDFLDKLFKGPSMKELQILYATDNNLTEIPESINKVVKLGLLDLSMNKLTSIPSMGPNVSPVQLAFDGNLLTELKVDANGIFCDMSDLESIICSNNKFTTFPDVFSTNDAVAIKAIDFSINLMEERTDTSDASIDAFKGVNCDVLNLSHNLYETIPIRFSRSKSKIAFLNMSTNKIDTLRGASLMGMVTITALDFSGNRLSTVPLGETERFGFDVNLPHLSGVDVSRNSYETIPSAYFNGYGINSFYISDQSDDDGNRTLTEWPAGIEEYLGLRVLLVDGNDLRTIRKMPTLLNLFAVNNNPNLAMEVPFEMCRRLSEGTILFHYDVSQTGITGCPILGIGEGDYLE